MEGFIMWQQICRRKFQLFMLIGASLCLLVTTLLAAAQASSGRVLQNADYAIQAGFPADFAKTLIPSGADQWTASTLVNAPGGKYGSSGVWTGSEVIVWGGQFAVIYNGDLTNAGARYNPRTNTWQPTSLLNAPSKRYGHSALWTGQEMLIGTGSDGGGRYNPVTDSWLPISPVGSPPSGSVVWTGNEMLVWNYNGVGGRYDPKRDVWRPITTTNAPQGPAGLSWLATQAVTWTGHEMIVYYSCPSDFSCAASGGRYNPATDTWQPISLTNAPRTWIDAAVVWTGQEMVVYGGAFEGESGPNFGARYNPALDAWQPMTPSPYFDHTAVKRGVWTGSEVILAGTNYFVGPNYDFGVVFARYDIKSGQWDALPRPDCEFGPLLWTGNELFLWGNDTVGCSASDEPRAAQLYTPAYRTTQVFNADADTYIAQGHATESFGSDPLMFTGYDPQYKYYAERMLLHFPIGIPARTNFEQATAYLYLYAYNTGATPMNISAHRATGSWNENSTWQSSANNFDTTPASAVPVGTTFGWYSWDVTSTARKWLSGTPNYGLMFNGNTSGNRNERVFLAREAGADAAPFLAVTYTDPAYAADSTPPTAGILGLAAVQDYRNALAVEWSGYDQGRGINNFDVQVRDESTGIWIDWYSWAVGRSAYFSGETGHTYCFRVRARDYAGNLGNWSTDDRCTTFYAHTVGGQIVDHRHAPIANADLQVSPTALSMTVNSLSGQYALYFADDQPRQITVTQPAYAAPPVANIAVTDANHYTFVMQPSDNVIANSNFESGTDDWAVSGTLPFTVTSSSHSGDLALSLNAEFTSTASMASAAQTFSIPATDAPQILSFMYNLTATSPFSNSQLAVTLAATDTVVTIWGTTTSCAIWCHAWVDVSEWSGQSVTLTISLDQSPGETLQATVDEVVLGSWHTPIIEQVTPARIDAHISTVITLTGQNFLAEPLSSTYITGPTVLLNMTPLETHWSSTTTLTVTVPATMPFGLYTIWVSNPGGFSGALRDSLRVGHAVILPLIAKNN